MHKIDIQRAFAPFRHYLPAWISGRLRAVATAILTPVLFSYRSGHFRSSLQAKAVERDGEPLPWLTYPCIDFLKNRSFAGKVILEFGGGQSTLWWAKRAKFVVSLEGDKGWYERIRREMPSNVDLHLVSMDGPENCVRDVLKILNEKAMSFDVVVIDGLYRFEMAGIARHRATSDGAIICDNAEGYGFWEAFRDSGLQRVDFFGYAPGVVRPHATSILFRPDSFLFSAEHPIPIIANEG